jgi:hypothetical protein
MSYRREEKFHFNSQNTLGILKSLKDFGAEVKHPPRPVCSLYFDSSEMQMFHDSEEGIVPRRKFRLRTYNTEFLNEGKYFSEVKISSVEGRFKISEETSKEVVTDILAKGTIIKGYGQVRPTTFVIYQRQYFLLNNLTITVDTDIVYRGFNSYPGFTTETESVLEIKGAENREFQNFWDNLGVGGSKRFSKYCRAMLALGYS